MAGNIIKPHQVETLEALLEKVHSLEERIEKLENLSTADDDQESYNRDKVD